MSHKIVSQQEEKSFHTHTCTGVLTDMQVSSRQPLQQTDRGGGGDSAVWTQAGGATAEKGYGKPEDSQSERMGRAFF